MRLSRRHFVRSLLAAPATPAALAALGMGSLALASASSSSVADYRAVVAVFLGGGVDGNDMLVRTGAGYQDYFKARPSLALPLDALKPLKRGLGSEKVSTHPSFALLNEVYESGRLLWMPNVGPLVEPATVSQVMAKSVRLPPFMGSHPDQSNCVQGWDPVGSSSGWGGRGLERLPATLRSDLAAISMGDASLLVSGDLTRPVTMRHNFNGLFGQARMTDADDELTVLSAQLGRASSSNRFEVEYERSYAKIFESSSLLARIRAKAVAQNASAFPDNALGRDLGFLARMLPQFKAEGIRRQIFCTDFGRFDTHAMQRGDNDGMGLDIQIEQVCQALLAWDQALRSTGMDAHVVTLVFTEFGRTLAPAGSGTDHGWGAAWWVMGTPVQGGRLLGNLPVSTLGGPDDWDEAQRGRWVPQFSADQVGATLLQWLGVEPSQLTAIFPNLANFSQKTLDFV